MVRVGTASHAAGYRPQTEGPCILASYQTQRMI